MTEKLVSCGGCSETIEKDESHQCKECDIPICDLCFSCRGTCVEHQEEFLNKTESN